jgi:hypothetical protein
MKKIEILSVFLAVAAFSIPAEAAGAEKDKALVDRTYDVKSILQLVGDEFALATVQGELILRSRDMKSGSGWSPPPVAEEIRVSVSMQDLLAASDLFQRIEGWDENGQLRLDGGLLRVTQPPAVQEHVAAFLEALRARIFQLVAIEAVFVPTAVLDEVAPSWRARAPEVDGDVYGKLLADPRSRILTGSTRNGVQAALGDTERALVLSDYEVNQTGSIPVVNPVLDLVVAGDQVEVRPRIQPGGKAVRVDLWFEGSRMGMKKERVSSYLGDYDLPFVEGEMAWTSVLSPAGRPVIAGEVFGGPAGEGGLACIVRATPIEGLGAPAKPPAEMPIRVHGIPLDLFPPPDRAEAASPDLFFGRIGDKPISLESLTSAALGGLREAILERAARAGIEDGELWVLSEAESMVAAGSEAFHRIVEESLRSRAALPRLAAVDLRLFRLPRASAAALEGQKDAEGLLKAGWEGALKAEAAEMRCLLLGLEGQVVSARRDRGESLVTDIENVSGGTNFESIEVADPITEKISTGFAFAARVRGAPERDRIELECRGIIADTDLSSKTKAGIPFHNPASQRAEGIDEAKPPAPGKEAAPPAAPGEMGFLEIQLATPRQKLRRTRAHLRLPPGRDAVLDLWTDGDKLHLLVGSARFVEP